MNPLLDPILQTARQLGASDVHLQAGARPIVRLKGQLGALRDTAVLDAAALGTLATPLLNERQRARLAEQGDVDFAYIDPQGGRYRVNLYQQRGQYGLALRVVPLEVPPFEELNLPEVVLRLAGEQRGLILVTGATGSGKSTTLAAMIDFINSRRQSHILTIEDPIEFLHQNKRSMVNQRELEIDTSTFGHALRSALRQNPDVILVGEMRDLDTIATAIVAAETGHLVLSTLHTMDAVEAIHRILVAFPPHQQAQIRIQLASILKGVVSQRLVARADGQGLIPAVEVLIGTERVRELIEDPARIREIHDCIAAGRHPYGMISFDQCLTELVQRELITYDEAYANASRPDNFALAFRGIDIGTSYENTAAAQRTAVRPTENETPHGALEIDRFGKK